MTEETKSEERTKLDSLRAVLAGARGGLREAGVEDAIAELLIAHDRAIADIDYARNVLRSYDAYASGGLDGMVREAATVLSERAARIDALLREASAKENERRMWKNRAETWERTVRALTEMIAGYFGEGEKARADAVARIAERASLLEKDAWSGAAQLAKEFVKQAEVYTPETAWNFLVYWRDRFRAVTNVP